MKPIRRRVTGRIACYLPATPRHGLQRAGPPSLVAVHTTPLLNSGSPEVRSVKNSIAPWPSGWCIGTCTILPWEFPRIHPLCSFLTHRMATGPANSDPLSPDTRAEAGVLASIAFWFLLATYQFCYRLWVECWASMQSAPSPVTTQTHFHIKEV